MLDYRFHDGGRAAAGMSPLTGDCVVRAVSIATARALGKNVTGKWYKKWWNRTTMMSEAICYINHTHLNEDDYQRCVSPDKGTYTDILLASMGIPQRYITRAPLAHPQVPLQGANLIAIEGHVMAVIDNIIYDTFDWREQALPVERWWHITAKDLQT